MSNQNDDQKPKKPNVFQIVLSTLAAAFGVQSSKNRERDFTSGSVATYIIAGVIFTAVFVFGVLLIVRLVLANAS